MYTIGCVVQNITLSAMLACKTYLNLKANRFTYLVISNLMPIINLKYVIQSSMPSCELNLLINVVF